METLKYPQTVDVSLTGKCQLRCSWCWGEEHTVGTIHSENEWKELLRKFKDGGTTSVVFTGGEPLLSPILPSVLRYAKESLSMRTTLSTNAILLAEKHEIVLPWVDDLGIPIDGSTSEINKRMRAGKIDNFQKAIDGIKMVLDAYPDILLTVRTVIARPNIQDVGNIPQMLMDNNIDISRIRYKLYQVEPIGPRADVTNTDQWKVSEDECKSTASAVKERYPNLSVTLQLYSKTSGRYYQIGPRGNAYGTYIDETDTPQIIELGNPIDDFDHAIGMLANSYFFHLTH